MAADVDIRIEGVRDIQAALRRLPASVANKAVRGAVQKAVGLFRDEARRRAPKRTGALKRAITAATFGGKGKDIAGRVYVSRRLLKFARTQQSRKVFYAHLVEFGFTARDGSKVPGKGFMRAAYETQKGNALKVFSDETQKRLDAAIKSAR